MRTVNQTSEYRLSLPETILLESEQFEQAKRMFNAEISESQCWQSYISILALLGFEQWLKRRLRNTIVNSTFNVQAQVFDLQAENFKLGIIASEHVLDEVIYIPKNRINQPASIAQFYVAIEVLEEQEEAIVRGFLPYDQLVQFCDRINRHEADCYPIPMAQFDSELNHLVAYCRYLEPSSSTISVQDSITHTINISRTKLSEWLQSIFNEGWMSIEALINPEAQLLLSTRNTQTGFQRGKLINLGLQLDDQTVAIIITVTPKTEEKLEILVQLHPIEGTQFLPPNFQLTLISKAGKTLQTATARQHDNYIQLKPFKGKPGQRFCIEVTLNNRRIQEEFEF